jgi:hypothetical protein
MRLPGRRKLVVLLIALTTIGFLFLSFQMISVHLLSEENHNSNYLWNSRRRKGGGPLQNLLDSEHVQDPEEHQHIHNQFLEKYLKELQREEGYGDIPLDTNSMTAIPDTWWSLQFHGVPPHHLQMYQDALDSGTFACTSQPDKLIPFSQVNDDFCDCPKDGSDEPGTEACAAQSALIRHGLDQNSKPLRFFCRFQLPGAIQALISKGIDSSMDYQAESFYSIPLQFTLNSRVNDGICDCCDGSDEWKYETLIETLPTARGRQLKTNGNQLGSSSKYNGHAPCINSCSDVMLRLKQRLIAQKEGKSIKEKYILEAKRHFSPLYGEDSEFYLVSTRCYQKHSGEYRYTVCPFRQVQQQHNQGLTALNLGRKPSWENLEKKILLMSGGSDQLCPGRQKRKSFIQFRCAIREEILSAMETDVCVYTFELSTPAAC